jgi:hypothetical protein
LLLLTIAYKVASINLKLRAKANFVLITVIGLS